MSVETENMDGSARCPLCDDYEGGPSSVEAHISRMTDPVHQGEVGRAHRDDIQRQASEGVEEPEQESATDLATAQWVPTTEDDESGEETDEEPAESDESGEVEEADEADAGPSGIPLPVSQGTFFVSVIVVAGVLFWLSRRSSSPSGSSTTQPTANQEDDENRSRDSMGGLS